MLRLSDRGIPPHMLHLYQSSDNNQSKHQFNDDAARLPSVLRKFSDQIRTRLAALRQQSQPETYRPDSAKSASAGPRETQYLGEVKMRDTRWHTT